MKDNLREWWEQKVNSSVLGPLQRMIKLYHESKHFALLKFWLHKNSVELRPISLYMFLWQYFSHEFPALLKPLQNVHAKFLPYYSNSVCESWQQETCHGDGSTSA